MSICNWCKKEMSSHEVDTCNAMVYFPDGVTMAPVPYNSDYGDENHRCHDCNIKKGGVHHPGCDMEKCPRCGGQLISCDCQAF